MEEEELT